MSVLVVDSSGFAVFVVVVDSDFDVDFSVVSIVEVCSNWLTMGRAFVLSVSASATIVSAAALIAC
ncbi:hypothetical protein PYR77_07035 [Acinetobacter soli]|nr:hypothetical protein [Acinetobacter soli]WEH92999.1 hypothetical protein PYR75_07465 [Acinetobacter soli]WEH97810.1 hypothetical protein PYR76_16605 [Acinetobacter soli]WEI01619.1 hypothetical protein PYR77_07035 [Acinetobacter soli]